MQAGVKGSNGKPLEERVRDLLARMTLEEKVAQLGSVWVRDLLEDGKFSPEKARKLLKNGIGQITRIAGGSTLARVSPISMIE